MNSLLLAFSLLKLIMSIQLSSSIDLCHVLSQIEQNFDSIIIIFPSILNQTSNSRGLNFRSQVNDGVAILREYSMVTFNDILLLAFINFKAFMIPSSLLISSFKLYRLVLGSRISNLCQVSQSKGEESFERTLKQLNPLQNQL